MKFKKYISENAGADWRGCLMLSMASYLAHAIDASSKHNIPEENLAGPGRETYSHCTVLYGFPQWVQAEEVEPYVASMPDFTEITLGKIKRFTGNPEYDVLYIDVSDCYPLYDLHGILKDHFNIKTNFDFNPHVTIAYVKPGSCLDLDGNRTFDGLRIRCTEFTYSSGPSDNRNLKTLSNDVRNKV